MNPVRAQLAMAGGVVEREWGPEACIGCDSVSPQVRRGSRGRLDGRTTSALAIFDFIEGWYNPHRRHSALDQESPLNYERRHQPAA